MPEFYAEPMKDMKTCSLCKKTAKEKGKKKLQTCRECHAISYCSKECQVADWARHSWNCVPVMVTEFPGKGRGLVAARDIEKGELIFKDEPVITLATNAEGYPEAGFMTSLKEQIASLPTEAKSQYDKLMTRDDKNVYNLSRSDFEVFKLFLANSIRVHQKWNGHNMLVMHLNVALVNHSCVPNARIVNVDGDRDNCRELRAFKNICKGEEITICYFDDVKTFGCIQRKWKTALKKNQGFDCKCPVCLDQVPVQEKTLKKLIEQHNKLNPKPTDWKREAGVWSRIVDLTMELYIGSPNEKVWALDALARFAHLARDKVLLRKAVDKLKQFAEDTKLEDVHRFYEDRERCMAQWSTEFSSNSAPKKREIDIFLSSLKDVFYQYS